MVSDLAEQASWHEGWDSAQRSSCSTSHTTALDLSETEDSILAVLGHWRCAWIVRVRRKRTMQRKRTMKRKRTDLDLQMQDGCSLQLLVYASCSYWCMRS
jgi:hypothetical protein